MIIQRVLDRIAWVMKSSDIETFLSRLTGSERNPDEFDKKFKERLKQFPNSPELLYNYARFLWEVPKDYDRTEDCLKKAIELDDNPRTLANTITAYARLQWSILEAYDKAEELYKKGIELDPENTICLGDYALFLADIRKDYDRAEELIKKAIGLEPKNATNLYIYAWFLTYARKEYDRAEECYRQLVEMNQVNAFHLGAYAQFSAKIRKDSDRAEELFKKAVALDWSAVNMSSYAIFLMDVRKDYDRAEWLLKNAVKRDPKDSSNLARLGLLWLDRKDYGQAARYYQRAIALDPTNANYIGNNAKILIVQGKLEEAKTAIVKAFEYNQSDKDLTLELELWFHRYAMFYQQYPDSRAAIEALLAQGVKSPEWDLQDVLKAAKKRGHPDFERLSQYEMKITGKAR